MNTEAVTALGEPLTPAAANHLFVALAMDTGWFRHANTRPATFALAEKLELAGAEPLERRHLPFDVPSHACLLCESPRVVNSCGQ